MRTGKKNPITHPEQLCSDMLWPRGKLLDEINYPCFLILYFWELYSTMNNPWQNDEKWNNEAVSQASFKNVSN